MAIHANLILDESPFSSELLLWASIFWPKIKGSQISIQFVDGLFKINSKDLFDAELLDNHAYSYVEIFSTIIRKKEFCQEKLIKNAIQILQEKGFKTEVFPNPNAIATWIENSQFQDITLFPSTILRPSRQEKLDYLVDYWIHSQPPILILPSHPVHFSRIILSFDGSLHSIQTIKKFFQLFSFLLKNTELIFMTIIQKESLIQEKPIIDYIKSYQENFSLIRTYPSEDWKEIIDLAFEKKDTFWVSGFSRKAMAEFLRNPSNKVSENSTTAIFFE